MLQVLDALSASSSSSKLACCSLARPVDLSAAPCPGPCHAHQTSSQQPPVAACAGANLEAPQVAATSHCHLCRLRFASGLRLAHEEDEEATGSFVSFSLADDLPADQVQLSQRRLSVTHPPARSANCGISSRSWPRLGGCTWELRLGACGGWGVCSWQRVSILGSPALLSPQGLKRKAEARREITSRTNSEGPRHVSSPLIRGCQGAPSRLRVSIIPCRRVMARGTMYNSRWLGLFTLGPQQRQYTTPDLVES
ncbi:hypothetical protein B0J13DRAFT_601112 [Dactylonectria estremocensis]|uniref:Uncharacterized protein n=1 Tax=Dactylonectria estremocensis TaxID=1079267 RepID=A0A9P9FGS4_9HYPO|nr:hypothetical protein B0J13DRAFT_601112 [Dactylonectria estremocensis]